MKSNNHITVALGLIESSKNSQSGSVFGKNGAGWKFFPNSYKTLAKKN